MRFPSAEELDLPCRFEALTPGQLHSDGRRYLPLIILRLPDLPGWAGANMRLAVVDRHHRVDPAHEGHNGSARLVFLLSRVRLLTPPVNAGLFAEPGRDEQHASTRPTAIGQIVSVPTWEVEREHLPYEELSAEVLLNIGAGVIGVRTNTTAASLTEQIGKPRLEPGDWISVERSRIDILAFTPLA